MQKTKGWQVASLFTMVLTFHSTKSDTLLEFIKELEKGSEKKPKLSETLTQLYHLKLRIETKMEAKTLEEFIKLRITAADFDKLPQRLGISQHKLTRILNRPTDAGLDEVLNLAALLTLSPIQLVDGYKMGFNNITLDEYERFKNLDKAA